MKWVLIWVMASHTGGLATGSAQFETDKACLAAQAALGDLMFQLERQVTRFNPRESSCLNTETGERKTAIRSLDDVKKMSR